MKMGAVIQRGDATLILAKNLEEKLRLNYGVTCILTRTTGDITLGGYTNNNLDEGHISFKEVMHRKVIYSCHFIRMQIRIMRMDMQQMSNRSVLIRHWYL